jgi:hypothetical protein
MKVSTTDIVSILCALLSVLPIDGFTPTGTKTSMSTSHRTRQVDPVNQYMRRRPTFLHTFSPQVRDLPAVKTGFSPFEAWCVSHMEKWYLKSLAIKCPFFRRRASDILDAVDMVMRFVVIRHKSLALMGPPPAWRCKGKQCNKSVGLSIQETADIIRKDWKEDTNKSYYITGKLNTTIYRDDCLFDGPDPDMPVRGLRKYLNAASQLFDQHKSFTKLLSLEVQGNVIVADWKMSGVLMLPWHPSIPEWTGRTTYHRDENGLIYKHDETWDMSVFQAFLRTFWPQMAETIWRDEKEPAKDECLV